jgi:excisionase family DNA binding protein
MTAITGDADLFQVDEVARMWRVSRMTIYRLVRSGELNALRVERGIRIPRCELERYVRDHMNAAA